jgi:hypothetical protein
MVYHALVILAGFDAAVEDAPGIGLAYAYAPAAAQGEEGEEHGVHRGAHVDDDVVMRLVYHLPYLSYIDEGAVALVVGEGDDAAQGGMALEERCYALVEHKVNLGIGVVLPKGAEQRRGQDGIAHLAEAYDKYLHNSSLNSISRFF